MKNEKGFTLIEVIISIALVGVISIAFLSSLSTASRAVFIGDERTNAESLARSQMEYVKNNDYADNYSASIPQDYLDAGYSATIVTSELKEDLQQITVTVSHGDEVITLEGYKTSRL